MTSIYSKGLDLPAKLLWAIPFPTVFAIYGAKSPAAALFVPATLLPTVLFVYRWTKLPRDRRADMSQLTYVYFGVATLGIAAVATAQSLGFYGLGLLLFGREETMTYIREFMRHTVEGLTSDQLAMRAHMATRWQFFVLLTFFSYVTAGGLEEYSKYLPLAIPRSKLSKASKAERRSQYVQYAVAAGLGFATLENMGFALGAAKGDEGMAKVALNILERMAVGVPGHVMMACLTAINALRTGDPKTSARSLWRIVGPSAFYHGTFDLVLFVASAWHGNIGWIHPTDPWTVAGLLAFVGGMQVMLARDVWRGWKALKQEEAAE